MKTFSLRLTDIEAEALERLARVNGLSKNKQIQALIARAYIEVDEAAQVIMGGLQSIVDGEKCFFCTMAESVEEAESAGNHELARTKAEQAYRQYKYVTEEETGEEVNENVNDSFDSHAEYILDMLV